MAMKTLSSAIFMHLVIGLVVLSDQDVEDDSVGLISNDSCPEPCTCQRNLTIINCARKNLLSIPKNLPSSSFIIYLGHNHINTIQNNSFSNLRSLRDLYINNNKIVLIEADAFSGLSSLKLLSLTKNLLMVIDSKVLKDLTGLEKLFLTMNKLQVMPDFSSIQLRNISQLIVDNNKLKRVDLCKSKTVVFFKLSTLVLSNNLLHSLSSKDFECINPQSLIKVKLSRNEITTIENDTFSSFYQLQSIVMSYNNKFSWQTLTNLTTSVSLSRTLYSLDLSGIFVNKDLALNATTFKNLAKCPILHLLISNSKKISKIKQGTFDHFSKLETLDLSKGTLTEIEDSLTTLKKLKDLRLQHNNIKISNVVQLNLPKLESLNLNENPNQELLEHSFAGFPKLKTLTLKSCGVEKIFTTAFDGLLNLVTLDLSKNGIGGSSLPKLSSGCPNLKEINLSSNKMTTIYAFLEGLFLLENLDLSNNNCYNISERMFKDQSNLKHLNLAGNNLGAYFSTMTKNPNLFGSLFNLLEMNLQGNSITSIPDDLFHGLNYSQTINLSSNHLTSIKPLLYKNLTCLENIDMSKNLLINLNPEDVLTLPLQTSLDISFNPFDCYCDIRPFVYWLRQQNSSYRDHKLINVKNYRCSSPVSMAHIPLMEFNPDSITALCNWFYILIGSLLILFVIVFIIGMLIFRFRWRIRFGWFLFKKMFKTKSVRNSGSTYGSIPSSNDDTSYEMTISYHKQDKKWVFDELIPRLERWKRGIYDGDVQENNEFSPINGFLFVAGYTSNLGGSTFNQICEAMMNSGRVIHCISKNYLKCRMCKEEINVATHSRLELDVDIKGDQGLYLILLEPQVDLILPAAIRPLRASNYFCEWYEDEERQALFWDDLRGALKLRR